MLIRELPFDLFVIVISLFVFLIMKAVLIPNPRPKRR